jgi:hypothetical protein
MFNMTSAATGMAAVSFSKEIAGDEKLRAVVDKIVFSFRV